MDFDNIAVPPFYLNGAIHVLQFKRAARQQRIRVVEVFALRKARRGRTHRQRKDEQHRRAQTRTSHRVLPPSSTSHEPWLVAANRLRNPGPQQNSRALPLRPNSLSVQLKIKRDRRNRFDSSAIDRSGICAPLLYRLNGRLREHWLALQNFFY